MKQSDIFRENAENCAHLAETAGNEPNYHRYKRMEAAWRALADEQEEVREDAHQGLLKWSKGEDFGPTADADKKQIEDAQAKWRSWLTRQIRR